MEDHRVTITEIISEARILFGSVQSILTDHLCIHYVAKKFIPSLLTPDQKVNCVCDMLVLILCITDPNFMKRITVGDETCIYGYNPEIKTQSS